MPFSHLLLVLVACLVWAFNFLASAVALQHFSPFLFTLIRFALVLVVLLPFFQMPPAGQWGRLTAVALLTGALHFAFNFWGLKLSDNISSVAIVVQAYIPMSTVFAALFLGERVGWRSATAIAVAFVGVVVMGFDPEIFRQIDSVLLVLTGALFLSIGTVLMRGIKGMNPVSYQAWSALISVVVLIPLTWWIEQPGVAELASAEWKHWGGIVYSALGASIVGHGVFFFLVQRHPVSQVTPFLLLTPLFAVLLGVLFWDDRLSWGLMAGGSMILGGVLAISIRAKAKSVP